MAKQFLKRLALTVLGMVIAGSILMFAYIYVVPFVVSGQALDMAQEGGEFLGDSIDNVQEIIGGGTSTATEKIRGKHTTPVHDSGNDVRTSPPSSGLYTGTVDRVIDGDTLVIDRTTIRLALVNTPERGEPGYNEAKTFTLGGCPVDSTATYRVDSGQTGGSYGRTIAKVWCHDAAGIPTESLNEQLYNNRHAEILTQFCEKSEFGGDSWAAACIKKRASTP